MISTLSEFASLVDLQLRFRKPDIAWAIHQAHGNRDQFSRMNGEVVLRDTSIAVNAANARLLTSAGPMIQRMASSNHSQWTALPGGKLQVRHHDFTFELTTFEDVFVFAEIFYNGVYELTNPDPGIVIDIGANIGLSSLFFASKPWVSRVFSFEVFKPTAAVARTNIDLNPQLRDKITLNDYGLGGKNETLSAQYTPEWKANLSREGIPKNFPATVAPWTETITIRDAAECFGDILDSVPSLPVIVKMDCEGAEWDILPRLHDSGRLNRVVHLILEYHHKNPEPIEQMLLTSGFSVIRRMTPSSTYLGLIYATRVARS
jgi:FkbM family methyltransferase